MAGYAQTSALGGRNLRGAAVESVLIHTKPITTNMVRVNGPCIVMYILQLCDRKPTNKQENKKNAKRVCRETVSVSDC